MQDYGKLVALQDRNFILSAWKNVKLTTKKVETPLCVRSLSVSKKSYPVEDYWSKDVPDDNDVLFKWEPFEGTKRNLARPYGKKAYLN